MEVAPQGYKYKVMFVSFFLNHNITLLFTILWFDYKNAVPIMTFFLKIEIILPLFLSLHLISLAYLWARCKWPNQCKQFSYIVFLLLRLFSVTGFLQSLDLKQQRGQHRYLVHKVFYTIYSPIQQQRTGSRQIISAN